MENLKVWVVYRVSGGINILSNVHGVYATKEKAESVAVEFEKWNPNCRCYFQKFEVEQ